MSDSKLGYGWNLLANLGKPTDTLRVLFREDKGARIGHSTVVSQKMHTVSQDQPEVVTVLQNVDAGQTFYHRRSSGEVYHLDVFHQCGGLDHREVAARLRQAVETYNYHYGISHIVVFANKNNGVNADLVDIQTGKGGGRITGSLTHGQKLSLRRAHENHVHIAAMLPEEHLACLFYLVMATEEAVTAAGLELRRNERITHGRGGNSGGDMSPYSDQSDSFLRQRDADMPASARSYQYRQDMTDLADEFDTVQDVKDFLAEVDGEASERKLLQSLSRRGSSEQALQRMEGLDLVTSKGGKVRLTPYGQAFKDYLDNHLPDMEAHLRRTFRLFRPPAMRPGRSKLLERGPGGAIGQRTLQPRSLDQLPGELATAETVSAAARRITAGNRTGISITAEDLREFIRQRKQKAEICLVIDASASMAGQRIRAAKFLARHLLLSTPDRLSIVTFQEDAGRVVLPFTRDWRQAEESLRQITSCGSTPLAGGLTASLTYLKGAGARNPLIILISDGIATVGEHSRDPLADALEAAAEIKRHGYGFACIGLKPHQRYLTQLAEQAGGSVYVLEELEKHTLVKTTWNECAGRYL